MTTSKSYIALATLSLLLASAAATTSPSGGYAGGYTQSFANGQVAEVDTSAWSQAEGVDNANAFSLLEAAAVSENEYGGAEALSASGAVSLVDQDTEGPPVYAGVLDETYTEQYGNGIAASEAMAVSDAFINYYKHYVPPIPCYGKHCWYPEPEPHPVPHPEPCDSWWCDRK
jgi:hypothetical protein